MKIPVETSARHVHVTQEHLEILFGKGAKLTHKKDLSQPGQFACEERVTVTGGKKELTGVSILGPVRPATQVELSLTDTRVIGVPAFIRESGDIGKTTGCRITGPAGSIEISEGVIVAKRHLHTTPADAKALGVNDKDSVRIALDTPERSLIFGDVVVRVSERFFTAVHIDTDETNAANCNGETYCFIVK